MQPKQQQVTPATETQPEEDPIEAQLYSCPWEGCMKTFQRHYNLEQHLLYGKCKIEEERYSLIDMAKLLYRKQLVEGSSEHPHIPGPAVPTSKQENLTEGWALKSTKSGVRFNDNQKSYLDDKFKIGQDTGNKADPTQVAHDMRHTKNAEGKRRFTVTEFLTPQQIQSYFSRTARKIKKGRQQPDLDQYDLEAAEEERAYHGCHEAVLRECQLVHPIVYDNHNICHLVSTGRLKNLTISTLRLMCEYFHMDVESITAKRKLPYATYLSDLVKSCSCSE